MENIFFTSLTTPEVRQLFRQELESYFNAVHNTKNDLGHNEQPVSTKELIAFLDITEPTLIRWRKKGIIPFLQIGSRILYQKSEVLAALRNKKGLKGGK
jgi:hypothetical protein